MKVYLSVGVLNNLYISTWDLRSKLIDFEMSLDSLSSHHQKSPPWQIIYLSVNNLSEWIQRYALRTFFLTPEDQSNYVYPDFFIVM
jgi:hypothetical protein